MFYRYEMRSSPSDPWKGCFQYFFPDQRRYIARWLKEPKWYQNHPDVDSKCWFTQEGISKYGGMVEEFIEKRLSDMPEGEMRLLQTETLENLVMHGRIQCIQKCEGENYV